MKTEVVKIQDLTQIKEEDLISAVNLLRTGEIVAFPTETVYGLGASIYSEKAIKKIFEVKGRPQDNPLIVHISSFDMLHSLVEGIPEGFKELNENFWPGPLTFLFKKSDLISDLITTNLPTVAIRMPSHPIARKMIELLKVPIAAPSANLSGKPSPTSAQHVFNDLNGKIPLIIDGGMTNIGVESTVIDLFRTPPLILRPGGLNFEDLKKYLPDLQIYGRNNKNQNLENHPPTPGLKYRHYSPKGYLILIEQTPQCMQETITQKIIEYRSLGKKIGIIHLNPNIHLPDLIQSDPNIVVKNLFTLIKNDVDIRNSAKQSAQQLFDTLRFFDNQNIDIILVESISEKFEGLAVMNRLRKAASEIIQ